MSLLAIQSLLARLYTDSAFRARFFDNPDRTCREMALTEAEWRHVAALDRGQVERFAQSLRQKRLGLVRELLPGAARVLGERFGALFFQYCDRQPSALDRIEEAMAFTEHLSGTTTGPEFPDYLEDLLACERLRLAVLYPTEAHNEEAEAASASHRERRACLAGKPPEVGCTAEAPSEGANAARLASHARPQLSPHARVGRFDHDMEALYPSILRGNSVEAQPDPCFILIGKLRGAMRVRLKRINAATARLLALCDGTRTLATIVDEVAAGLRLNAAQCRAFAAECAQFLAPLVESELIRLSHPGEGDHLE
jgi:hypothetical protein